MLNWTTEAILYFISGGVFILFVGFTLVLYVKTHYHFFLYLTLGGLGGVICGITQGFSLILLNIPLHILGVYFLFLYFYGIMLAYDALSKNLFGFVKYTLLGVLLGAGITTGLLDPNAVTQFSGFNGDERLLWSGTFELVGTVIFAIYVVYITIAVIRLLINVPVSMKKASYYLYLALVILIGLLLATLFNFLERFPGIDALLMSLFLLCNIIAFYREPKLAFILPFKLLRLDVIHTRSGIPLFSYLWEPKSKIIPDALYSGVIQGVCLGIKESSGQGDIEEIKLSNGVLLLKRYKDYPIACVLAVDRTSKILRMALGHFIALFIAKYEQLIPNHENTTQFEGVSKLIQECFPFVPDYE